MTTAARRARTIAATTTELRVGVLDRTEAVLRHALAVDGSLLFLPPAGSPLAAAALMSEGPVVTATAHDVAPVPAADRVRGTVVFGGRPRPVGRRLPAPLVAFLCGEESTPGRPVLELAPTSIHLRWQVEGGDSAGGYVAVPVEEYAAASPDPLAGWEGGFLRHLDEEHSELLAPLADLAGLSAPWGWRVRPVLADATGLVLRASDPQGRARQDVRLDFDRAATCGCDAVEGFNRLLERAGLGAPLD